MNIPGSGILVHFLNYSLWHGHPTLECGSIFGFSTSDEDSYLCTREGSRRRCKLMATCNSSRKSGWSYWDLASALFNSGYFCHLGSDLGGTRWISLSLPISLFLCSFAFQTNKSSKEKLTHQKYIFLNG